MAQVRCESGHFYDEKENTRCPHCAVPGLDLGPVKPKVPKPGPPPVPGSPFAHRKTIAMWPGPETRSGSELDPVVGWLVAVEGPAMGRDFRIRWGNNSIGRLPSQAVPISEDERIHGEEHAFIVYDPRSNRFILRAGAQRGLVYVNENLLVEPLSLEAYCVIQLGATKLVFVPLCGESFQWSFGEARQP